MDLHLNTTATTSTGLTEGLTLGIVKICLFSTFFILGLIGNSLVLVGIGLNKGMQTPTNLLIFNLALADILFIIVCIPTTLFSFFGRWPFTNVGCKLGKRVKWWPKTIGIDSFFSSSAIHQSSLGFYEHLSLGLHVDRSIFRRGSRHRFVRNLSHGEEYHHLDYVSVLLTRSIRLIDPSGLGFSGSLGLAFRCRSGRCSP